MSNDPSRDWQALRLTTGLSLSESARRAAINKGRVSEIENRWRMPTPAEASALLRVYREALR